MFDVDSHEKINNSSVRKRIDQNTKKIIAVSVTAFIVVFLISYIFFRNKNDNYNDIKEDKNNFLIYTKYEKNNTSYQKHIPYINIKGDVIKKVNDDIDLFSNDFKNTSRCSIFYQYDINGIILSIVLKAVNYNVEYAPEVYFRSYNINLSTLEVISNDTLLNFFNTSEENTKVMIENKFKYFYQEIIKSEYYQKEECNYECFLNYRNVENYMDNVNYYVKNGNLIAFKPFVFYSIYGEEDYFKDKDFEFLLVKTEKNK